MANPDDDLLEEVVEIVQEEGWITQRELAKRFDRPAYVLEPVVSELQRRGQLQAHTLGTRWLIIDRSMTTEEAVAEWFDEEEQRRHPNPRDRPNRP